MHTGRLEAFSDGVIAILITIMVLELRPPHEVHLSGLWEMRSVLLSYILSFIYLGIYWNNHHHLFQAAKHLSGGALWANLHLLFWLSMVPFATAWMGDTHFAKTPVAIYGAVLLMCALAYELLSVVLVREHTKTDALVRAMRKTWKEKLSCVLYAVGIPLAYVSVWAAAALYAAVAVLWFIPDARIERQLAKEKTTEEKA